ncbi:MAG: hypothetical protein K940chlam8_00898 [Chlamydiae bacterium]|nr:hypothetical protein [Chlamydiota bacterium]
MTVDSTNATTFLSEAEPRSLEKKEVYRLEDLEGIEGVLDQARTRVKRLDLSSSKLTTIPEWVLQLENLEYLNVSNNHFDAEEVKKVFDMKHVKVLVARNCNLKTEDLKGLDKNNLLTKLDLSANSLHVLLDQVAQIDSLRQLYLADNNLEGLPVFFNNFRSLDELDLSHNALDEDAFKYMKDIQIRQLDLSYNKIKIIPDYFAKTVLKQNLKVFNTDYNPVKEFPKSRKVASVGGGFHWEKLNTGLLTAITAACGFFVWKTITPQGSH